MLKKYELLLKVQLYGLFGINRLLHSHDPREKKRLLGMGAAGLLAVGVFVYLSCRITWTFAAVGLAPVLPPLMLTADSALVFILTFLKSQGSLVGMRDYDQVISLPVSDGAAAGSRLTMIYLLHLGAGAVILLPAAAAYAAACGAGAGVWAVLLLGLLLAPLLPMSFALAAGVGIAALSARSRHSHMAALVFSTAGILLFVAAASQAGELDAAQLADLGAALNRMAGRAYPPAKLFSRALAGNAGSLAGFVLLSAAPFGLFSAVLIRFYKRLNTMLFSHRTGKNFRLQELAASSPFRTLFQKELVRFFSCTIYALNSSIVMVLLVVLSFAAAFVSPRALLWQLEAADPGRVLYRALPLGVSAFACLSCSTSASLSLEGKSRWLMCSAPVPPEKVFRSKIAVNLAVLLPCLWLSLLLLRLAFPLDAVQTVLLVFTPTCYALFISVMGMWCNVKFPRYDWSSEYYAVKGGAVSVLAGTGAGLASCLAPLALCMAFAGYAEAITAAAGALALLASGCLYRRLARTRLYI